MYIPLISGYSICMFTGEFPTGSRFVSDDPMGVNFENVSVLPVGDSERERDDFGRGGEVPVADTEIFAKPAFRATEEEAGRVWIWAVNSVNESRFATNTRAFGNG